MRRHRSRRRGPRTTIPGLILFASGMMVIAFSIGGGGLGAASFSTADSARSSSVNVASDELAAHSLDVAPAVHINSTDPLVNVTNRLRQDAIVTVKLRADSAHMGDLIVDGSNDKNETTFSLSEGNTKTVKIKIPDDTSLTSEIVYFHVDASAPGLDVTAPDRSATVEA